MALNINTVTDNATAKIGSADEAGQMTEAVGVVLAEAAAPVSGVAPDMDPALRAMFREGHQGIAVGQRRRAREGRLQDQRPIRRYSDD